MRKVKYVNRIVRRLISAVLLIFYWRRRSERWNYLHLSEKVPGHCLAVNFRHVLDDHFRLVYSVLTEKPPR